MVRVFVLLIIAAIEFNEGELFKVRVWLWLRKEDLHDAVRLWKAGYAWIYKDLH